MEANENVEPAPEVLPTETTEAKPKKTKLLAVIIVAIMLVAAIAAALVLMGTPTTTPGTNHTPSAGARADKSTINIGDTVTFTSMATDVDNDITDYAWYFGDGIKVNGTAATAAVVNHTYTYGGSYLILHVVTDKNGSIADNEVSLIRLQVLLYSPALDTLGSPVGWSNTTAPHAYAAATNDIIKPNTTIGFNMTGSYGMQWVWNNASNHSELGFWDFIGSTEYNMTGLTYLSNVTLQFGDNVTGYATAGSNAGDFIATSHNYTKAGHYAAKVNVSAMRRNATNVASNVTTQVIVTIHVLKPTTTSTGSIKNPNAFIVAEFGGPQYLDPALDYESAGGEVLNNVYDTLVTYDRDSPSKMIPALALEVPTLANGLISADGKNVTYNLRQNVKMHDGTTMNASDVVYSIQRVLRMHDPSSPVWMLEAYMNGYMSGFIGQYVQNYTGNVSTTMYINASLPADPLHKITEADVQAVAEAIVFAPNSSAVTFRLLQPYLPFVLITAYTVCDVVSMEYVEASGHGGIVNGEQNVWMKTHMCGAGPYQLVSWDPGSKIHLARFDDYWGAKPALKDVFILQVDDVNQRILMLQSGDADSVVIDIAYQSNFADTAKYRIFKGLPDPGIRIGVFNLNIDTGGAASYQNNVTNDFFVDVHVRKAFCHLFDYATFNSTVLMGNANEPNSVITKGLFGYNASIPKYNYSLWAAENELKQAMNISGKPGKSWWDDGFKIALFYNTGNTARQQVCLFLQKALNDLAPGKKFDATVNSLSWGSAYLPAQQNQHSFMPFYFIGWGADFADADDFVQPMLYSTGTYPYYSNYNNSAIDAKIVEAQFSLDPVKRAQLYSEISMLAYEDPAYILAYQPASFHVERTWVAGYYFNPMFGNLYFPALSKA
jgi:peptide/nickel transport system substrate-binding protein